MKEVFPSNLKRREILLPLLKWRYLGNKELKIASKYKGTRNSLNKLLLRLEKDGLVEGFLHLYANRKFWNLSKTSWSIYSEERWNLNGDIKNHDAIASAFLFGLNELDFVSDSYLNFPSGNYTKSLLTRNIEPDGYFEVNVKDWFGRFALEIELNRKNKSLIESKYESYYESKEINGVVYVFNDLNVLEAYYRFHEEFKERANIKKNQNKIAFCFSDILGSPKLNIPKIKRIDSQGNITTLGELFL